MLSSFLWDFVSESKKVKRTTDKKYTITEKKHIQEKEQQLKTAVDFD